MRTRKQKRELFKRIVKGCYWLVLFLCVFCVFGTLLYFIPLISDIASTVFLPAFKLLFVLIVLFVAASIVFLLRKRNTKRIITCTISVLTLIAFCFISVFTVLNVNKKGEPISLLKAFTFSDTTGVVTDEKTYIDQNENEIPLSVLYVDDAKSSKPVILYTHGGGWISGSRTDRLDSSKALAKAGYVVVCADYDLSGDEVHLYDFTEKQLLHAVNWCTENAAAYGGDMSRFYMVGDSAGGNLALNLSYKIACGEYEGYPAVKAVSLIYPVTDIRSFYETDNLLTASTAKKLVVSYMGSIPSKEAGRYAEHDPGNYADQNSPPTLIVYGRADSSVEPKDTYKFSQELREKGVENKLIKVPFANHAGDVEATNFLGQAYLNNTLAWLEAHQ